MLFNFSQIIKRVTLPFLFITLCVLLSGSVSANPILPWYQSPSVLILIIFANLPINLLLTHIIIMVGNFIQRKEDIHDITEGGNFIKFIKAGICITLIGACIDFLLINLFHAVNYSFGIGFVLIAITSYYVALAIFKVNKILCGSFALSLGFVNIVFWNYFVSIGANYAYYFSMYGIMILYFILLYPLLFLTKVVDTEAIKHKILKKFPKISISEKKKVKILNILTLGFVTCIFIIFIWLTLPNIKI